MFQVILVVPFLAAADVAAQSAQDPTVARVQTEILALARELNEAALKQDRKALERIFATEFVAVHAYGYVDDRATHITEMLRRADKFQRVPTFDPPNELLIYGDVAVVRSPKGEKATDRQPGPHLFS